MQKLLRKDKINRLSYLKSECDYLLLKNVIKNNYLTLNKKNLIDKKNLIGGKRLLINNCCIKTGRSHGVNKYFKLFRSEILCFLKLGRLEGIVKIIHK